ncbi:hypothetical protein KBTX_03698 [wastewater metagenome]|uniref:Uncharacterized protein n=2 Tax=unclassified sequences TaxID=12908 RepID=A0A5B8RE96_9ZZZZ|nr:hypothetical protein KBTEX_03698 [uncultured organism]
MTFEIHGKFFLEVTLSSLYVTLGRREMYIAHEGGFRFNVVPGVNPAT